MHVLVAYLEPSHGGMHTMQSSIFLVAIGRASGVKWEIDGGGLLISLDGVAPTQIVNVSASCYPP